MASVMSPFHALLKPSTPFSWNDDLQHAFDASKSEITSRIKEGVTIFEKDRPTCLATDWSKDGIGYWLSIDDHIDDHEDNGLAHAICAAVTGIPLDWESLQIATASDPTLQELTSLIESGPPTSKRLMPTSIRE